VSKNVEAQIVKIETKIADLRARMPKHSVPPSMMIELEELEEALARLKEGEACG
jgi:hypothetical protein